jgi:hypothetical protein
MLSSITDGENHTPNANNMLQQNDAIDSGFVAQTPALPNSELVTLLKTGGALNDGRVRQVVERLSSDAFHIVTATEFRQWFKNICRGLELKMKPNSTVMAAVEERALKIVPETAITDFSCMIQAVFGKSTAIHE